LELDYGPMDDQQIEFVVVLKRRTSRLPVQFAQPGLQMFGDM